MSKLEQLTCVEAEKSLLSCLFLAGSQHSNLVSDILDLDPYVFTDILHRKIFLKFGELSRSKTAPDPISVAHFLNAEMNLLADGKLLEYMVDNFIDREPSAYCYTTHAAILTDLLLRRKLYISLKDAQDSYIAQRDKYISAIMNLNVPVNCEEICNFTSMFTKKGN